MYEFLCQPWHWSISGALIALVMFLLVYLGKKFGVSTSYQVICSAAGGGRTCDYFNFKWKSHSWLLFFIMGSIIGGAFSEIFMGSEMPVAISESTIRDMNELGISFPRNKEEGSGLVPTELFNFRALLTPKGFLLFVLGGFFIGFGTRWAGGCTSGHAITGLSNLDRTSLIAVIGFFIGGLIMTHLLFPLIFSL